MDKFALSKAPVRMRDMRLVRAFEWFVSQMAQGKPCPLRLSLGHRGHPMDLLELAESFYRALDLYLWLASRYPEIFFQREQVMEKRELCSRLVTSLLDRITVTTKRSAVIGSKQIAGAKAHANAKTPDAESEELDMGLGELEEVLGEIESISDAAVSRPKS